MVHKNSILAVRCDHSNLNTFDLPFVNIEILFQRLFDNVGFRTVSNASNEEKGDGFIFPKPGTE